MENIERPEKVTKAQRQEMTPKNQQKYDQDQFTKIYDYLDALNGESKFNIDLVYPVGSIYMSVNNTNPADLFGGEWEQLKDRFLIGAGGSYSGTGGSMSKTFSHNHNLKTNINANSGSGNGIAFTAGQAIFQNNNSEAVVSKSITLDITPSYMAVYMWKRIN